MKYLTFIVTLLSLLIASALLVIAVRSCAPNAHAEIRVEWIPLPGTEGWHVNAIETDGRRLYAATWEGGYISLDNGNTWSSTEPQHGVSAIAIDRNNLYAATFLRGVFRSDSHGDTWSPKNNGIRMWERDNGKRGYPIFTDILVTSSGTVITVGYTGGTYISNNRGETWHNVADEWIRPGRDGPRGFPPLYIARRIRSMTEFDGYLWVAYSSSQAFRSPDNGETWEGLPYWADSGSIADFGTIVDWAVLDDRLYVAGHEGIGRWNEAEQRWELLNRGLPVHRGGGIGSWDLAVNRGRIFAAPFLYDRGVWLFDRSSETWAPVGPQNAGHMYSIASHGSDLYATGELGIYRAWIPAVQPYGKFATTWGAIKGNPKP